MGGFENAGELSQSYTACMVTFEALQDPQVFSFLFAALILLRLALQLWLLSRQARHVRIHQAQVPEAFADQVSAASHRRSADYTVALTRWGLASAVLEAVVLVGWTLLGGLDGLNHLLRSAVHVPDPTAWSALAYQVLLLLSFMLIGSLIELPLDVARHFVIERRFGFNRMTPRLYLTDLIKSTGVGLLIGVPLLALILTLMNKAGTWWWLWTFAALAGFQLAMVVVYPTWIAPLFNRFTPLSDPQLEARVRSLMQRCGFKAKGLLVMDGSRRSAHANAYFTGLGRSKRVVFFDTLLQRLTPDEVEAVLAHELGHFSRRHITQRLVLMLAMMLILLAALGALSGSPLFYVALGVQPNLQAPNDALALALFTLSLPVVTYLLAPVGAWWSRHHEFEADAYAAQQADRRALGSALVKLHEDNAATLTPDPWYVRFHYSHPPALQRLQALGLAPSHPLAAS